MQCGRTGRRERMDLIREGIRRRCGLSGAAADTLMASWAAGSQDNYDSKWKIFSRWCSESGRDPLLPEVATLLAFLQSKFEDSLQHSTIRGYATAIGLVWRHWSGKEIDSDDLVSRFLSGVAKSRPAAPKYEEFMVAAYVRETSD